MTGCFELFLADFLQTIKGPASCSAESVLIHDLAESNY